MHKSLKKKIIPKIISFFGGVFGGGSQEQRQAPPPITDTARSVTTATVIEVISSGGTVGVGGLSTRAGDYQESIFLDETPLRKNGIPYFTLSKDIEFRYGSPFEAASQLGVALTSETQVGATVVAGLPLTRSFINPNINVVTFKISVVLLANVKDGSGNVVQVGGNNVTVNFYVKEGAGAFNLVYTANWGGKFSTPYEMDLNFLINTSGTNSQFSLRVERVTAADSADDTRQIRWESYSEVIYDSAVFKGLSRAIINFDAEAFGTSFPERRYLMDGIILPVPTNASVDADGSLTYTGTWNGLLYTPGRSAGDLFAIVYFLLTNTTDGLGNYIDISAIDKWSLQTCSVYNNKFIATINGYEKRVIYNLYCNKAEDGWKTIDSILSASYTRKYWEGGILKFTQDSPSDIFACVSNADIEEDFQYSSTNVYQRTNSVVVTWCDPQQLGKSVQEYVTIPEYVSKFGTIEKQIECVGCYRRTQAIRYGRHIVYSENRETSIVTFTGRAYLSAIPIGKVILVADSKIEGRSIGGIVLSASTTGAFSNIELDAPLELGTVSGFNTEFYLAKYPDVRQYVRDSTGTAIQHWLQFGQTEGRVPNGYMLYMMTPNGIFSRQVLSTSGNNVTIDVISTLPLKGQSWALLSPTLSPRTYRVISKEPKSDNLSLVTLTCTQYDEEKFSLIEKGTDYGDTNPVITYPAVPPITGLNFSQYTFSGRLSITVKWTPPKGTGFRFKVGYRKSGLWIESLVFSNDVTIENILPGVYTFRVQTVSFNNTFSDWVYSSAQSIGI
jgi:predicted phage tail protein